MVEPHMGDYEVLSHIETLECSLRLLRLGKRRSVNLHYHEKTTQLYFVLEGLAEAIVGSTHHLMRPYEWLRVPVLTPHSISARDTAMVLSISVPALDRSDQHVAPESEVIGHGETVP